MVTPASSPVRRQIVLPLSTAVGIAYQSIRLRLSRSLLVTSGIVLSARVPHVDPGLRSA